MAAIRGVPATWLIRIQTVGRPISVRRLCLSGRGLWFWRWLGLWRWRGGLNGLWLCSDRCLLIALLRLLDCWRNRFFGFFLVAADQRHTERADAGACAGSQQGSAAEPSP